jgi:hypothetical protein
VAASSAVVGFAEGLGCANPVFDESGHFVAYTTLTGIKVGSVPSQRTL